MRTIERQPTVMYKRAQMTWCSKYIKGERNNGIKSGNAKVVKQRALPTPAYHTKWC